MCLDVQQKWTLGTPLCRRRLTASTSPNGLLAKSRTDVVISLDAKPRPRGTGHHRRDLSTRMDTPCISLRWRQSGVLQVAKTRPLSACTFHTYLTSTHLQPSRLTTLKTEVEISRAKPTRSCQGSEVCVFAGRLDVYALPTPHFASHVSNASTFECVTVSN